MLREHYLLLKQRLSTEVTALKHIDWNLGQLNQNGDDPVPITPAAYIAFLPIEWETLGGGRVQRGLLEFEVTQISDTAYGDERDMLDTQYINHLAIESQIFQALQGWRARLSMLPEFAALAGTAQDHWVMETIIRRQSDPHNVMDMRAETTQVFQTTVFDYSADPQYQQVLASFNINCI